jgi:4-hydroxy-4-methyl-2-oxoglutarate aldolase
VTPVSGPRSYGEPFVELLDLGAACVGDGGAASMSSSIRPAWAGARVAGPAFTLRCAPGDNLALHVAVAEAPAGSVLVADATAEPEYGYWGEVLTRAAMARGIVGLVIDGGVRDVDPIEGLGFPVFSERVCHRGASKQGPGSVGGPVVVGGVPVGAGDLVVGDRDGVSVLAPAEAEAVLARARSKASAEPGLIRSLDAGATTIELLGLDAAAVERAAPT